MDRTIEHSERFTVEGSIPVRVTFERLTPEETEICLAWDATMETDAYTVIAFRFPAVCREA